MNTHFSRITGVLALAFLLRVAVAAFSPGNPGDMENWYMTGTLLMEGKNFYTAGIEIGGGEQGVYTYFPGWAMVIWLIMFLSEFTGIAFNFLVRIPPIIADTLVCGLIYQVFSREIHIRKIHAISPLQLAFVYAINPVTILVVSHHGQQDSLPILFLILAIVYEYRDQWKVSALLLGIGIVFKPIPGFMGLLFLIRRDSWRGKAGYFTAAAIPTLLFSLPFLYLDSGAFVQSTLGYKSGVHAGWMEAVQLFFLGLERVTTLTVSLPVDGILTVTKLLLVLSVLLISWGYHNQLLSLTLWEAALLIILVFYSVSAGMHPYYTYWATPFLILVFGLDRYVVSYLFTGSLIYVFHSLILHTQELPGTIAGVPTTYLLFGGSMLVNFLFWLVSVVGVLRILNRCKLLKRSLRSTTSA